MAQGDQVIRIGVTQRVEVVEGYGERRDCLDQRWSELLGSAGLLPVPLANHFSEPEIMLENLYCAGFIMSGGNDLAFLADAIDPAPERDRTERVIFAHAHRNRLPLLGVCRGMQHMNYYLGGELQNLDGHVAVRHGVKVQPGFIKIGPYEKVNSYHNRGLSMESLADDLETAVLADDGSVEAVVHRVLPWIGIMWHPEREKSFRSADLGLLKTLFKEGWLR